MSKRFWSLILSVCMVLSLASFASAEEEPVTLSIFIDHSWYPVESFTGIIPEYITEKTGVTLDVTVAIDANQLGVMLSSGDLPDLIYTQNMVDRCSDPAVSYSYEDLIAQYCPDWEVSPKQLGIARNFSEDGVAYTLLNHYSEKADWEGITGAVPMVGTLMLRGDILDALGEKQPTSFDELFELFGKVKTAYPDMTPLRLSENWNTLVFRYLNGMSQLEFIPQEDGVYEHFTLDPRYEEMLLWLNKCYRAGYLIADDPFFVKGSTAIPDDKWFASCSSTQNSLPSANGTLAGINPDYYAIEMVPFPESSYITSDTGWSALFITKNCKNPEAAIKMMQWMFSEEGQYATQMGRKGIEYTLNENGLPEFSDEWKATVAKGSDAQNSKYNTWFYFGGSEIVEAVSRCATTDPKYVADCYAVICERFDNWPWVMASYPMGEDDEKIIYDKIKELLNTAEAQAIMAASEEECRAVYADYLQKAERIGMDELNEYVNNTIAEKMPMFK